MIVKHAFSFVFLGEPQSMNMNILYTYNPIPYLPSEPHMVSIQEHFSRWTFTDQLGCYHVVLNV